MMNRKVKILLICLIVLFIPRMCLALSITGYAKVGGGNATLRGAVTCTATGDVDNGSVIVELSTGECEGGGIRHGTDYYCCGDAAHNAYSNCTIPEYGCRYRCSEPNYSRQSTCESHGGSWYRSCIRDESTNYTGAWIPDYFVGIAGQGKNKCGSGSVTCTSTKGGRISASFKTFREWSSHSVNIRSETRLNTRSQGIDNNKCNAYYGTTVDGIFIATTAYNRCCGGSSGPAGGDWTPDDKKVMGCWRRKISEPDYDHIYDEADYYEYKWDHVGYSCSNANNCVCGYDKDGTKRCNSQLPNDGRGKWELYRLENDSGMNQELCEKKKTPICQPTSPTEFDKLSQANYCNAKDLEIPLDEHTKCESTSNVNFYKIDCTESVKVSYNPYNFEKVLVDNNYIDEKIAVVQPGNGFKYDVNMNHVRSCEGFFNYKEFNKVFNNTIDLLRRADIYGDIREYAWYHAILDSINLVSKTYEDQYTQIIEQGKYLFAYDGTISFNYKWGTGQNPETMTKTTNFINNEEEEKIYLEKDNPIFKETYSVKSVKEGQNVEFDSSHNLKPGIVYNRNLYKFKYTLHQESLLEPKRVYIDRKTAKETNSESGIDGGKKIYTEEKTNITEGENYPINSILNVYKKTDATKAIAKITNDRCELKVYKNNVIYRIIEPTNPFVNASRPIPKNWSGNIGDFTKAINPNIGTTIIK